MDPDAYDILHDAAEGRSSRSYVAKAVEKLLREAGCTPYWCKVAPEARYRDDDGGFPGYTEHRVYVRRGSSEGMVLEVRSVDDDRAFPQVRAKMLATSRAAHRRAYEVAEAVAAILNGFDG